MIRSHFIKRWRKFKFFFVVFLTLAYNKTSNKIDSLITDTIEQLVDINSSLAEFVYLLNTKYYLVYVACGGLK